MLVLCYVREMFLGGVLFFCKQMFFSATLIGVSINYYFRWGILHKYISNTLAVSSIDVMVDPHLASCVILV